VLNQLTKDGRHASGSPSTAGNLPGGIASYSYRLAVPRDTALNLYIASHDLKAFAIITDWPNTAGVAGNPTCLTVPGTVARQQ